MKRLIARAREVKTEGMARAPSSPLEADIAAALAWWREAGVDAAFTDEPVAWLADSGADEPAPQRPAAVDEATPVALEPQIGGPSVQWPRDLAAFHQWWLAEPSLDEGGLAPRIAPAGEAGAELMILVEMPEEADADALLTGPDGAMLEGFLRAAGVAPGTTYRAAVLTRHTPLPDWPGLQRQGLGAVLAHHVVLARPKRLIVFGGNILPLCGHDPAQGTQNLRSFNHEGGRVPALFAESLERLRRSGARRARLWKRWLDWTDGTLWDGSGG